MAYLVMETGDVRPSVGSNIQDGYEAGQLRETKLPPAVVMMLAKLLRYNAGRLAPSYVKTQARQGAWDIAVALQSFDSCVSIG